MTYKDRQHLEEAYQSISEPTNTGDVQQVSTEGDTEGDNMTVSELIGKLEQIKKSHGDLNVLVLRDNSPDAASNVSISKYIAGFRKMGTGVLIQ